MENAIAQEIAEKDVQRWMDFKNLKPRKREERQAEIETIIESICDGDLILDKEFNFIQTLRNPVVDNEGKSILKEFKFKPRLLLEDVEPFLMNVKSTNMIGMLAAYTSALTGVGAGLTKKIDTDENKTTQAIVMFFL